MGKNILLLGGNSGLGRSLFLKSSEFNHTCYLLLRNSLRAKNFVKKYNLANEYFYLYQSLDHEIKSIQDWISKKNIEFDIGIHAIGFGNFLKIKETRQEDWKEVFEANFFSAVTFTNLFLGFTDKKWFEIIFFGSESVKQSWPKNALYGSTKAALKYYCQILSEEIPRENGRVWHYSLGSVDTEFFENTKQHIPKNKMLNPEKISDLIFKNFDTDNGIRFSDISLNSQGFSK